MICIAPGMEHVETCWNNCAGRHFWHEVKKSTRAFLVTAKLNSQYSFYLAAKLWSGFLNCFLFDTWKNWFEICTLRLFPRIIPNIWNLKTELQLNVKITEAVENGDQMMSKGSTCPLLLKILVKWVLSKVRVYFYILNSPFLRFSRLRGLS